MNHKTQTDMLCIDNASTDIYFNLATEEYLLKNHAEDIFMIWQSKPAVVIGKHQFIQAEINTDFVQEHSINIARRYSGGGAVYHDLGNINLTFITRTNRLDFSQYTRQTLDCLSSIGIHAEADARMGINIGPLKISGSAQCIYKDRIMYHCTLLYSTDLDTLNSSLSGTPGLPIPKYAEGVRSVRSKVTNISNYLCGPPGTTHFKEQILAYFLGQAPGNQMYGLSQEDTHGIEQLRSSRYAVNEWIWSKSASHKIIVKNLILKNILPPVSVYK